MRIQTKVIGYVAAAERANANLWFIFSVFYACSLTNRLHNDGDRL